MPMYDLRCSRCERTVVDAWQKINDAPQPCGVDGCAGILERSWTVSHKSSGAISDGIPGGLWIKHGLCNLDGTPRRYDSKTEMKREAAKRGLVQHVVHKGTKDGDKSKHTSRWV